MTVQPIPEESPERDMTTSQRSNSSPSKLRVYTDIPSAKYIEIEKPVNPVILSRAQAPPMPTLPRRQTARTWNATAKERNPLGSCLTGPGRAGKFGDLITEKGAGRFEGEVLAGRPHGYGKYFKRGRDNKEWILEYEGDWVQGIRQGRGIRDYANGENYDGDFLGGVRHGHGRYSFSNGDVYAGEWVDDKRTGHGTYFYHNGDVFVGNFIKDRKEGRGTLFMMARQRKYVAEYVSNQPKCGTILSLEDGELEPLQGALRNLALTAKLDLAASGRAVALLPELALMQPNRVLGSEVASVRKARGERGGDVKLVQVHSGTLSDREIEMLRHSFTLMAAGDGLKHGLLPHQLRELIVMAGLDPASGATRQLVEQLLVHKGTSAQQHRISFDDFMKVVIYFQEENNQVIMDGEIPFRTMAALSSHTTTPTRGLKAAPPAVTTTMFPPPPSVQAPAAVTLRAVSTEQGASPKPPSPVPTRPISRQSSDAPLEAFPGNVIPSDDGIGAPSDIAKDVTAEESELGSSDGDAADDVVAEAEASHVASGDVAVGESTTEGLAEESVPPVTTEQGLEGEALNEESEASREGIEGEDEDELRATTEASAAEGVEDTETTLGIQGEESAALSEAVPGTAEESAGAPPGDDDATEEDHGAVNDDEVEGGMPAVPDEGHPLVEGQEGGEDNGREDEDIDHQHEGDVGEITANAIDE